MPSPASDDEAAGDDGTKNYVKDTEMAEYFSDYLTNHSSSKLQDISQKIPEFVAFLQKEGYKPFQTRGGQLLFENSRAKKSRAKIETILKKFELSVWRV